MQERTDGQRSGYINSSPIRPGWGEYSQAPFRAIQSILEAEPLEPDEPLAPQQANELARYGNPEDAAEQSREEIEHL